MTYKDKTKQKKYMAWYSKCYNEARKILIELHISEFREILSRIMKGGKKNGKSRKN